jgi:hypothetical protein
MKALSKQPEKRFQTAEEFQRALHKFLYSFAPEFNPSDLGYYSKDIFTDDIVADRKRVQRLNESAEKLLASQIVDPYQLNSKSVYSPKVVKEESTRAGIPVPSSSRPEGVGPDKANKRAEGGVAAGNATMTSRGSATTGYGRSSPEFTTSNAEASQWDQWRAEDARKRARSGGIFGGFFWAALLLITISVYAPEVGYRVPYLTDYFESLMGVGMAELQIQGSERNASVFLNEKNVSSALPVTLKNVPIGKKLDLFVKGPAGEFRKTLTLKRGEKKVILAALSHSGEQNRVPGGKTLDLIPGKTVALKVRVLPAGGAPAISVNGRSTSGDDSVIVPLDETLNLVVERAGYRSVRRDFYIDSRQLNGANEYSVEVQLDAYDYGYLSVHTTPSADALITIDGAIWKKRTPFERQRIPVGKYTIRLVNEVLGMEKNVNVTVHEGRVVNVDESLEIK